MSEKLYVCPLLPCHTSRRDAVIDRSLVDQIPLNGTPAERSTGASAMGVFHPVTGKLPYEIITVHLVAQVTGEGVSHRTPPIMCFTITCFSAPNVTTGASSVVSEKFHATPLNRCEREVVGHSLMSG